VVIEWDIKHNEKEICKKIAVEIDHLNNFECTLVDHIVIEGPLKLESNICTVDTPGFGDNTNSKHTHLKQNLLG
jgi:hypothetical protein